MEQVFAYSDQSLMSPGSTSNLCAAWIDDSGREIPHNFIAVTIDARRSAFKYMKMVEVLKNGSQLLLRWNVEHVSPQAISTAAVILAESAPNTIVTLEFFWGAWARESGFRPANALRRMIDIAPYAHVSPFLGTKMLPRNPCDVREEGQLIRDTFEYWDTKSTSAEHRTGPDGLGQYSDYSLALNYDRTDSTLIVRHIGASSTAASVFGSNWAVEALGRAYLRSQPDYEYEERVCGDYIGVMETGEMRVDHVRAYIRRPNNDPIWVTYKRLLMRSRNAMGVPTLVAISEASDDIAIPLMVV